MIKTFCLALLALCAGAVGAATPFEQRYLYLDDSDQPMGGRYTHRRTGFTLDLLRIESAPQAFLYVNTPPVSDQGEPHTQEHVLLSKGNKGRYWASARSMTLSRASAYTDQLQTVYHFHTEAGADAFWQIFETGLDALLHPDYTDEEIRREVHHFGVTGDVGELRLEEKGTVYNEMVRSFEQPKRMMWRRLAALKFGAQHPMAFSAGGVPAAIRTMTPEDIRAFHHSTYHLGNMGMILALPAEVQTESVLGQLERIFAQVEADGSAEGRPVFRFEDLPAAAPATEGAIDIVDYPHTEAQRPGAIVIGWPALEYQLEAQERILLELFLHSLTGAPGTRLYERFIDTQTQITNRGITSAWWWLGEEPSESVHLGFNGVDATYVTKEGIKALRDEIRDELHMIAGWQSGAPELEAFNQQVRARVSEWRRWYLKSLNTPPRFGFRGTSGNWWRHLYFLERTESTEKSLTLKSELADIDTLLQREGNIWPRLFERWGLFAKMPFAVANRSSPVLRKKINDERDARIAAEETRLKTLYEVTDTQAALQRYGADYDAHTARLVTLEQKVKMPTLVGDPPMTQDDTLDYRSYELEGVPVISSRFNSMTGATVGIALRLDVIPERQLGYLSALPELLDAVGIFEAGQAIRYDAMQERLREDILSLAIELDVNEQTGRAELVARAAGIDVAEIEAAVEWLRRVLLAPDLRPENLPRIRDVVDHLLKAARNRMLGAEERWAGSPASAIRVQGNPLLLRPLSFLTREYDLHRLQWRLRSIGGGASARSQWVDFMGRLTTASTLPRVELQELLALLHARDDAQTSESALQDYLLAFDLLSAATREQVLAAAASLAQLLPLLPDDSLSADWRALCEQIKTDALMPPENALKELDEVRRLLLRKAGARAFVAGSSQTVAAANNNLKRLIGKLDREPAQRVRYSNSNIVFERLRERKQLSAEPLFLGLVNQNTSSGVVINTAKTPGYDDMNDDALLDYLSGNLYGGPGAHSIFMKTWGAGLAYSNGVSTSVTRGQIRYYAERSPELSQTVAFVIDELRASKEDPRLVDYAVAQAFRSRVARTYEARAEAMARDITDGRTPTRIRGMRERILALRQRPDLSARLYDRIDEVYGRVLPGYGPESSDVEGGYFFVIGPERQMARYEDYLQRVEGERVILHRLYPRDFWITAD